MKNASVVHASGISMAISRSACDTVLAVFGSAKGRISFDSNLRLKLWPLERARALIGAAAGMADYFFPSIEDARQLSGVESADENLDWAHALGAKTVFLKLGPEGVIVSDGKTRERIAGIPVKSVDATGAGDGLCGAALARLAAGDASGRRRAMPTPRRHWRPRDSAPSTRCHAQARFVS